ILIVAMVAGGLASVGHAAQRMAMTVAAVGDKACGGALTRADCLDNLEWAGKSCKRRHGSFGKDFDACVDAELLLMWQASVAVAYSNWLLTELTRIAAYFVPARHRARTGNQKCRL